MKTLILSLISLGMVGCSSFNTSQDTITIVNTQCDSIRCFETVNRPVRNLDNPYRNKK